MAATLETVLRLDSTDYNRELAKAEGRAGIFAHRFNRTFAHELTRIASATLIARFLENIVTARENIIGLGEDGKKSLGKIESGFKAISNAIKLTIAQALAVPIKKEGKNELPGFFDLLNPFKGGLFGIEKIGERFGIDETNKDEAKAAQNQSKQAREAQRKQIIEMQDLASKLADENYLAGLTNEQRRKELQMRLDALRDPKNFMGLSQMGILENAIERERLKSQLRGLEKIPTGSLPKPHFGSLTEVGGLGGGADNMRLIKAQDASIKYLQGIEKNTAPLLNAQPIGLE